MWASAVFRNTQKRYVGGTLSRTRRIAEGSPEKDVGRKRDLEADNCLGLGTKLTTTPGPPASGSSAGEPLVSSRPKDPPRASNNTTNRNSAINVPKGTSDRRISLARN